MKQIRDLYFSQFCRMTLALHQSASSVTQSSCFFAINRVYTTASSASLVHGKTITFAAPYLHVSLIIKRTFHLHLAAIPICNPPPPADPRPATPCCGHVWPDSVEIHGGSQYVADVSATRRTMAF